VKILMPAQINADGLLPFLAILGRPLAAGEEVVLDFSELRRVTPAGLVALVATVVRWRREHHPVTIVGLKTCSILGYLQRMDVFKTCGVELQETFQRHEAKGRFVPVRFIDHQIDVMGTDLAGCLAPGGEEYGHPMCDLYDLSWYVLTEIANNVRQHSRGLGYVSAQVNRTEGFVRLALADNGCGILKSFQDAGFKWSEGMTDAEAICKALEPTVSSKGNPTNEGVGLTLVAGLVRQTKGWLMIVSGCGVLQIGNDLKPKAVNLPDGARYQGTLVVMTFRQQNVHDYASLLHAAKTNAGLLQRSSKEVRFLP
jgi:anti-anti-sigma regulatory factor